jgi:mRNA-degrading endonuclease toxin of MazEF toxin-antitoxin module
VPTTTTIRGGPTEIQLSADDGMPSDCVLVVDNTFSAEKIFLTEYIATLGSVRMTEVCRMLAFAAGC